MYLRNGLGKITDSTMDFYPEGERRGGINNHSCLGTQGCIFTNEWFPSRSLCMYVMADTDRSV